MCGIAAIYAYKPVAAPVNPQELNTIRNYMTARGPDGQGSWIAPNQRLGLAHRRLAIIDLDPRAAQPMFSADGRYAIVFNGEIYNYRALRKTLEMDGFRFSTESDTEVLLQLFAQKREHMLSDLRGMFAFIIWDAERNTLFMARDPYGIKPLYYSNDGSTLHAASQVKALLAGGGISLQADPSGLAGFYLFGSVPEPFTLYQQIQSLPAGHFMWADASGVGKPQQWFSIAETYASADSVSSLPEDETEELVKEALLDSVRSHLVADVPVGAFLSAGIDSGSLVGLMRDAGANDIQTVTLAFAEYAGTLNDEAPMAEQVAKHYGTRHTTRRVGREEFEADLPHILHAMDQPSIDGINTWFVSKAAAEVGLKVAVSGLGGDELFGGYPAFQDVPKWVRWLQTPARIPYLGKALRQLSSPLMQPLGLKPKAAGLLELGGTWSGAYLLRRGLFMPWELPDLMGKDLAQQGLKRLLPLSLIVKAIEPQPTSDFARVACLESALYMRNQLLRDTDWAGMAHSLEIRVPLVDAELLKAIAPIAVRDRQWSKQRLASAPANPLPANVRQRAKTGFTTPVAQWLAEQVEQGQSGRKTSSSSRPWAGRVVQAFGVENPIADVSSA